MVSLFSGVWPVADRDGITIPVGVVFLPVLGAVPVRDGVRLLRLVHSRGFCEGPLAVSGAGLRRVFVGLVATGEERAAAVGGQGVLGRVLRRFV
ncbi:hypothetical protein BU198_24255 [Streptomyces sp. CBMA156]|nr:hypothetical protein [Streptomyces sp. CBMA156]MBD0673740.1 hypothetical protein [Streptomyces sp. CBMA156]